VGQYIQVASPGFYLQRCKKKKKRKKKKEKPKGTTADMASSV
jgi:hypothetical protein